MKHRGWLRRTFAAACVTLWGGLPGQAAAQGTPPDTVKPNVALTAPAKGVQVTGTVAVRATASDDRGVAAVQFVLDGQPHGAGDSAAPYEVLWDASKAAPGPHELRAIAFDAAGNHAVSDSVLVTVPVPADTVKPSVALTAPAKGVQVTGTVAVRATASDDRGVGGVQFVLDGQPLGAGDTAPPYEVVWDASKAAPGPHELRAIAFDAAGNQAVSDPVVVTVPVPADTVKPGVALTAPAKGAQVTGTVVVRATASDDRGVAGVQFLLDGKELGAGDTAAPYEVLWDASKVAPGPYELRAIAFDTAGNHAVSELVVVMVPALPDTVKPSVALTAPAKGAQVTGTVAVRATASDDRGVAGVQFLLDGKELGAGDTAAPYEVLWDASKATPGPHELRAIAFDAAGNQAVAEAVVVTVVIAVPMMGVDPQYLLFQLFTFSPNPAGKAAAFDKAAIGSDIDAILAAVAGARGDGTTRQLGFSVGPLALDHSDEQLRETVRRSFELALEKDVAVAVHLDDSMFWRGRPQLWNWFDPNQPGYAPANKENVEWVDWGVALTTPRIIGWAPTTLAPQMCFNSPQVKAEVERLARDVIGAEVKIGVDALRAAGKEHLFAGVIAGWETRLDDDSQPRIKTGYCAMHHLGYSAAKPPADFDLALEGVVRDFAAHWTGSLRQAGIPKERLYTHFAPTGDSPKEGQEYVHAPVRSAFNDSSRPGFSLYSSTTPYGRIQAELARSGSPRWANAEGTNINLMDAFNGAGASGAGVMSWERYLGLSFNNGAALTNVFAWQSPQSDPFGAATRSPQAIAAYKKFLSGGELDDSLPTEAPAGPVVLSSGSVAAGQEGLVGDAKGHGVQIRLPPGAVVSQTRVSIRAEDKSDLARESAKRAHERSEGLARAGVSAEITAFTESEGGSVTSFRTPVRITLGYDRGVAAPGHLGIYYWHEAAKLWREVPGATLELGESLITVSVDHLTTFAVFAVPQSAASLAFGEVFVFPNAVKGRFATIHVETDAAVERLDISIHDLAGSQVHRTQLTGTPAGGVNGKPAYEFAWDTTGVAAGGYLFAVEAYRDGRSVRRLGKFAVVK